MAKQADKQLLQAVMEPQKKGAIQQIKDACAAGADVNRHAHRNIEWIASFYARQAGKKKVANWLIAQMDERFLAQQKQLMERRDPKFRILYEKATAGESVTTDQIAETLRNWDEKHEMSVSRVMSDELTVKFSLLPDSFDAFYQELANICQEMSDDKREVKKQLTEQKKLSLWWD